MPIDSHTFKKGLSEPSKNRYSKEKLKVAIEELLDDCQARRVDEIVDALTSSNGSTNQGINEILTAVHDNMIGIIVIEILTEMVKKGKLKSGNVQIANDNRKYYIKKSCLDTI